MDSRRDRFAPFRRPTALSRARAVRGAEPSDRGALSAVVRHARRGSRRRARHAHPRELRPRPVVARRLCFRPGRCAPRDPARCRAGAAGARPLGALMQLKPIIQGLAAIWLVVFAVSFLSLRGGESDEALASELRRVIGFLTWQVVAFAVGAASALATRQAAARGTAKVKLVGYAPLAVSVFVIALFVASMAVRFYLYPLLVSS